MKQHKLLHGAVKLERSWPDELPACLLPSPACLSLFWRAIFRPSSVEQVGRGMLQWHRGMLQRQPYSPSCALGEKKKRRQKLLWLNLVLTKWTRTVNQGTPIPPHSFPFPFLELGGHPASFVALPFVEWTAAEQAANPAYSNPSMLCSSLFEPEMAQRRENVSWAPGEGKERCLSLPPYWQRGGRMCSRARKIGRLQGHTGCPCFVGGNTGLIHAATGTGEFRGQALWCAPQWAWILDKKKSVLRIAAHHNPQIWETFRVSRLSAHYHNCAILFLSNLDNFVKVECGQGRRGSLILGTGSVNANKTTEVLA